MNHRGLQRALFRMQLDADFSARLRACDPQAEASTGLGAAELESLRAIDPDALSADRDGRRRAQLLGNIAGEFALCTATAVEPDWLDAFPASEHFHRAVAGDASLPLAFGAYAAERAARGSGVFAALVALENELARARRAQRALPPTAPGQLVLAAGARLLDLERGTFDWASALREALDRRAPLPEAPPPSAEREVVLIATRAPRSSGQLRDAQAERLEPVVARFLEACVPGLDAAGRARFCREHRLEPAQVDAVAAEFTVEGVLLRG